MPNIVKLHNPFRKYEREIIEVEPGQSIQSLIDMEIKDNERFDCEILTFVNAQEIPKEQRPYRFLNNDEYLLIAPKAGDDDGKSILNLALMIGVFAIAPGMAASLAYTMTGYVVLKYAIIIGGAMLISALQPHPKKPSSGFIDDEQSQAFGWNPATIQRQGIAIPRAYGLNRLYGNVISAYTEKEARTFSETTITELYYYKKGGPRDWPVFGPKTKRIEFDPRKVDLIALFNIGIGPIREPVVSGSLMLNDQYAENLEEVAYEERCGDIVQQVVSFCQKTRLEPVVNRLVVNGTPVTYTTKNANFNDLEIELSFPRGLFDASGGDLANNTVNVTVEIKKTTAIIWTKLADNVAITDNVGDKVIETYTTVDTYAVEYGYNYDIRITKETAERDDIKYGDDLYLDKVREIIDHELTYPRMALVGVKAQATDQLSGSIRFSCLSRGLYVRRYSGGYGGAIGYSNNPADVIADILTQPVYTGEHSPWLDLKLLLNFEGADGATSTIDDSPKGHDITFGGGAELDTATDKFGAASLLLDGVDSYLQITNDKHSFDMFENLVENWTLDVYVKMGDHVDTEYICGQYVDANNYWYLRHVHGSGLLLLAYVGGVTIITTGYVGEIADNNWHHIAVCKVKDEIGLYKDETQIGYEQQETAIDQSTYADSDFYIGQSGNAGNYLFANIDHFRIIKSNIFSAAPVAGLTDTITEPAAAYTDPGNSYAVSRYDGYNPSKLLTADFEELADWCDDAEVNPVNFGIENITKAANAVVTTTSLHNIKVSDVILFRDVQKLAEMEITDGTTATILKVTNDTTFTIDLDTSAYSTFNTGIKLHLVMAGSDGATSFVDSSSQEHVVTGINNAQIDTGDYKYGSSSCLLERDTIDHLSIPNHVDWDFAGNNTDNKTFDCFFKVNSIEGMNQVLVSQYEDADNGWRFYIDGFGKLIFYVESATVGIIQVGSAINVVTAGVWNHVALIKLADKYGIFLNGVKVACGQDDSTDTFTAVLRIGARDAANWALDGWIDELKLSHSNIFNASINIGDPDSITVPTASYIPPTVEVYQPRFAFSGIFDTETNMWEAALSVCELCRCIPFWDGDTIRLAIDKAASSVYAFTMGNIIKDTFQQKFIPEADRASEIEIHFRDALRNYERTPFSLVNSSIGNTTSKLRLDLFGITDRDMANRLADFKLLQNLYIKQIAIWQSDIESIACTIGDRVEVQHDVTNWGSVGSGDDPYTGGGRIIAATNITNAVITIAAQIKLDDADFREGSTTYALLIKPITDGTPQSKVITGITESAITGGTYDITVSGTYTVHPQRDDIWAAGKQNYETKSFRIIEIQRSEDQKAQITGIEYKSEIYAND